MNLFFDTSALVKFFHEEEGTDRVTMWITSPDNEIWVSEIVRLEFISAVYRRFRNREIDEGRLEVAIEAFEEQMTLFNVEPLAHSVIKESERLLREHGKVHGLRTLDALHLGTYSMIYDEVWVFVASDENLCKVAERMNFKVINPLKHESIG